MRVVPLVGSKGLKHLLRWASPVGPGCVRHLHKGHVGTTLQRLGLYRHKWLDEVEQAPTPSNIRYQKEKFLREQDLARQRIKALSLGELAEEDVKKQQTNSGEPTPEVEEALRMYRLLRPEAQPFYEEDVMLGLEAKMNQVLTEQSFQGLGKEEQAVVKNELVKNQAVDPFQGFLPAVNPTAFLLALEASVHSLCEDLEILCEVLGIQDLPDRDDPSRFGQLVEMLFNAFPLKKDPTRVHEFMKDHWPKLKILLPEAIAGLDDYSVHKFIEDHLRRVILNQRAARSPPPSSDIHLRKTGSDPPKIWMHERSGDEEWYSFAEDFPYDDFPLSQELADQRNMDFPLEQAAEFMRSLVNFLPLSRFGVGGPEGDIDKDEVVSQFQEFVWDLERIGLRNWLKMDIKELEQHLPKGVHHKLEATSEDIAAARLMLRCAARGKANLLDFEAVDPYRLLHGFPQKSVEQELQELPENPHLSDAELDHLIDVHAAAQSLGQERSDRSRKPAAGASVADVLEHELNFYRTAGPADWVHEKDDMFTKWQWKKPMGSIWDERRNVYVPMQKGIDPNLKLDEMRQHLLDINRMGSVTSDGKIFYFRAIVIVGNGRGTYGFGVGFGNNPKEARADAALKGLQNLEFIDLDPDRVLNTPQKGREYTCSFEIIPRPMGRGIKCNKKFLPFAYILGLDNVKVRFKGKRWFTRIKAVRRAVEGIQSRKTLAASTGQKYASLVAPGDHWVHWPDRWFDKVRQDYDGKHRSAQLMRRHALRYKKRGNIVAVPKEVTPGWHKSEWKRWATPVEKFMAQRQNQARSNIGSQSATSKVADPPESEAALEHTIPEKLEKLGY